MAVNKIVTVRAENMYYNCVCAPRNSKNQVLSLTSELNMCKRVNTAVGTTRVDKDHAFLQQKEPQCSYLVYGGS